MLNKMDASINNDEFGSHHEGAKEKDPPAEEAQRAAPDVASDRGGLTKKKPNPVKDDLARKRALVAS